MQVQNCQNYDGLCPINEVHTVRKVTEESTMNFVFQPWELPRIGLDTLKYQPKFVEEAHTQTGSLVFVPDGGCLDIEVRLRLDDKSPCHPSHQRSRNLRSISVRTSAQGRPAVGFA